MNQKLPSVRTCLWCPTPIQGRADKKFCSNACKANYSRTTSSTVPLASTSCDALTTAVPLVVPQTEQQEEIGHWQLRCERAEELLRESHQSFLLHQAYADTVSWFLRFEGCINTITALSNSIQIAADNIQLYQQHPSLRVPGHITHFRFADFVFAHERMRQVRERRLAGEQRLFVNLPWAGSNDIIMAWDLSEEKRKAMWENLLAIG
jgi:predicted nucleic acid-binding Zn ribbon protein